MSGIWDVISDTFLKEDGPRCATPGMGRKASRQASNRGLPMTAEQAYAAGFHAGHSEASFYGLPTEGYGAYGTGRYAGSPPPQGPPRSGSPVNTRAMSPPSGERHRSQAQYQDGNDTGSDNPLHWMFGGQQQEARGASPQRQVNRRWSSEVGENAYGGAPMMGSGAVGFGSGVSGFGTGASSHAPPPASKAPARIQASRGLGMRTSRDDTNTDDKQDTVIGIGFGARLRAGVEQAEKQAEDQSKRTEMVEQEDGGFIATVQRGFMGVFGHIAMSKEEVLRKRGAQPASTYEAVPGDEIDQKVQYLARWLPPALGADLKIFRVEKGQYQIGDEEVELRWHEWRRPDGVPCREVFVCTSQEESDDGKHLFEPLPIYLQHSASVSHNLKSGHAVTQVPKEKRLSFSDIRGTSLLEADSDQRFKAMEIAAEQAKLREQAAIDWRINDDRKDRDLSDTGPTTTPDESRVNSETDSYGSRGSQGSQSGAIGSTAPPPAPAAPLPEENEFRYSAPAPQQSMQQPPPYQPWGTAPMLPQQQQHQQQQQQQQHQMPQHQSFLPPPPFPPSQQPAPGAGSFFGHQGLPAAGMPRHPMPPPHGGHRGMPMPQQMQHAPQSMAYSHGPNAGTFVGSQSGTFYGVQTQQMAPVGFAR